MTTKPLSSALLLAPVVVTLACGGEGECVPASGEICTVAGAGIAGYRGDEGPAVDALVYLPQDITVGPDDRLYIVDWNNHRIRVVGDDGIIRTMAGTGFIGDGPEGPALDADFNHPTQVIFDAQGNMVVAAWHNSRILRIDMGVGNLEIVGGTGARSYSGDGGSAKAAALDLPASIAFDAAGDLFIMDQANQMIRKIDQDGVISRHAGQCIIGECDAAQATPCPESDRLTCSGSCTAIVEGIEVALACTGDYRGDGGHRLDIRISQPAGQEAPPAGRIGFDGAGNLYFSDTRNHVIRRIDTDGVVETIAGTGTAGSGGPGGSALSVALDNPTGLVAASDGTVYFADTENSCIRVLRPGGTLETAAGVCGRRGFDGDGGLATEALLDRPYGVDLDRHGNLYIADTSNHRIRLVAP